jgi:Protein of unknown function (DUF3014)
MNENVKWIVGAVAVVGLSIGAVLYLSNKDSAEAPAPQEVALPPPMPAGEPPIEHPLPESQTPEPLPPLAESDVPMRNALVELIGKESVEQFLVPDEVIRHIVVTVDNLPDMKVAERIRPVKKTPGEFIVGGTEDQPLLDETNYERYAAFVKLMQSVDTAEMVTTYTRFYPRFQEAYESLGHPPQYFNDRLVQVIDHLLATPDVQVPIALARPGVLYEYADPNLELRSAGQKLLIRMGPGNATAVKTKLRELRAALVGQSATQAPTTAP